MKKVIIMIAACLLLGKTLNAQGLEWVKSYGAAEDDQGRSISRDASGNIYTTGYFSETVDFDPGTGTTNLTSAGLKDVFVQKMDADGNFLWAKSFGGTQTEEGNSISVDGMGNVYTTGYSYSQTVDFDPGTGTTNLTKAGLKDVFVQKMDSDGNFVWAKFFGSTKNDQSNSIIVDAAGNVYTTGFFAETVDFDPGAGSTNLTSAGDLDVFVQKMDSDGNFLWAKSFGGEGWDDGQSINVDALGNVYTTGYFLETVDFDPGAGTTNLTSAGDYDIFLHKMDADGNFLWANSFGGTVGDFASAISVDGSGNVYILGNFQGTVDFDPGAGTASLTSAGGFDAFVQKIDTDGNFLWAKSFGGTSSDNAKSINVDALGNIYTTGYFGGEVDFDPGAGTASLTSAGGFDAFVQKMDTDGNFLWAKAIGGTGLDVSYSISADASGNAYTTGVFEGTVDFDPEEGTSNLTSAGKKDMFILKMSTCPPLDLTTVTTGNKITANNINATYRWLDCDNGNAIIADKRGRSFTPSVSGNYAVEIRENSCVDTSACVSILIPLGITENSFAAKLKVYPNPSNGNFSIDLGASYKSSDITITDVSGKLVYSKTIANARILKLSIEEPAGLYIISIKSKDKKAVIRLVKE